MMYRILSRLHWTMSEVVLKAKASPSREEGQSGAVDAELDWDCQR